MNQNQVFKERLRKGEKLRESERNSEELEEVSKRGKGCSISSGGFVGKERNHFSLVVENRREIPIIKGDSQKNKNVGRGDV